MKINDRIFDLIKEKGITQKEFSARTGIPQSTISDWKGKDLNPSAGKILKRFVGLPCICLTHMQDKMPLQLSCLRVHFHRILEKGFVKQLPESFLLQTLFLLFSMFPPVVFF